LSAAASVRSTAVAVCAAAAAGALSFAAAAAVAAPGAPAATGSAVPTAAATSACAGAGAVGRPPAIPARAAALYAPQTGQLLLGINPHARLAIASTTKLMTALVTLEHVHHLSRVFTQNDWIAAPDDSQLGLSPGDRMSVHDLLIAMLLPSADDAAEDLAYNVGGGSVARFVAMMNAQARLLSLRDTHYSTPIGLDTPGNYSSAYDLVRLAAYDLGHSAYFARVVALPDAVVRVDGVARRVQNLNDLVGRYPWIDGVKTGSTADAGYVLVASAVRGGLRLISAVLGTSSPGVRDRDTLALLNWGYGGFALRRPVQRGQRLAVRDVAGVAGARAVLVAGYGFARVLPRTARLRLVVRAPQTLSGPLPARARVGWALVLDGCRVLARIPLRVETAVPAPSPPPSAGTSQGAGASQEAGASQGAGAPQGTGESHGPAARQQAAGTGSPARAGMMSRLRLRSASGSPAALAELGVIGPRGPGGAASWPDGPSSPREGPRPAVGGGDPLRDGQPARTDPGGAESQDRPEGS